MEKQAFALVKAIKDFRVYILHSHVIAYVPNTSGERHPDTRQSLTGEGESGSQLF
jgi:hypothetical protein